MAISEAFAGSETVSTTEHSLTTDTAGPDVETSDGKFQCFLDLSALANGDRFVFRIYEKVQSGDTQRVCFIRTFEHAQGVDSAIWFSPEIILMHGWDMTLDREAGSDRTITWSIRTDTGGGASAAAIADAVWDEDATGHQTGGTFGQAIGDPAADANTIYGAVVTGAAGATVAADIIAIKAETASILEDTAEIGAAGAGLTNINLPNQTMDIVGNITGNLSGSVGSVSGAVGSVTGAVGSVTGNVGGNVTGSVGSIATGGIVAASFAADSITAAKLHADVTTELQSGLATAASITTLSAFVDTEVASILAAVDTEVAAILADTNELQTDWVDGGRLDLIVDAINAKTTNLPSDPADASVIAGRFDTLDTSVADLPTNAELATSQAAADDATLAAIAALTIPTAAAIADEVWEEAIADHSGTVGSTAEALGAAGSAGDPWTTALPGAYGAGTAGKIIGDNINATISSRASQASVDTIDNFLDTEVQAILDDTNELQGDWVNGGRLDLLIDAIKAKTDGLPSDPADASVIAGRFDTLDTSVGDLPTNAELATALGTADDAILAQVALVKTETDKIASIKTKTDSLTFSVAGKADSNITHVNEIAVDGAGTEADPWGPV